MHGVGSDVHAYLNVVEGAGSQVWQYVQSAVEDHYLTTEITLRLCDSIDGKSISQTFRCPSCNASYGSFSSEGRAHADVQLRDATFKEFLSGDEQARRQAVIELRQRLLNDGTYRPTTARPDSWLYRQLERWRRFEKAGVLVHFRKVLDRRHEAHPS